MNEISTTFPAAAQTDYAHWETKNKQKKEEMDSTLSQLKKIAQQSSSNNTFDARQELSRIASATTRSQVKLILSRLGSRIGSLKNASGNNALIKKIKKVMAKGSEKMKHLIYEERIAKKAELAEKKRRLEESRKLREGLIARRTNRKLRELDDVKNADLITAGCGIDNTVSSPGVTPSSDVTSSAGGDAPAASGGDGISIYV